MSTLLPMLSLMALPVAGLVLAPANRVLVEANAGLVLTATLIWLLVIWTTVLAVVLPFIAKLMQTSPPIIWLLQRLAY